MNRVVRVALSGVAASLLGMGSHAFAASTTASTAPSTSSAKPVQTAQASASSTSAKSGMSKGANAKPMASSAKTAGTTASNSHMPMVGGAPMYPTKTIVQNASQAKNLTTLVKAVKQAGLADTLSGKGPYTVFAPVNAAFAKLPKDQVADLMKPENKDKLSKILTYHVVPSDISRNALRADLKKGNGTATFKTVEGDTLTVHQKGNRMYLTDEQGHQASIIRSDVKQSNGAVYVINSVLMPSQA